MGLFDSAHKKLWRAHQHAEALNESISSWQDADHEIVLDRLSASTVVVGVAFERSAPIQDWALLLGDAVHCWRSALDHAVYAMAVHDTGQNPPPGERALCFPIQCTPEKFGRRISRDLPGLKESSVAAVESVQPYRRATRQPGLLRLADLDNQDKHRSIRVVAVAPRDAEVGFSTDVSGMGTLRLHPLDTTKPDWILAFEFDHPAPAGLEIDLHTRLMVKLEDEPLPQPTVSQLLAHFSAEVHEVVAILERSIDASRVVGQEFVNGLHPPKGERWFGQRRPVTASKPQTPA
jgi:hypothetical protein